MSAPSELLVTFEQYLSNERQAEHKSEYWNGQVFAMAGATYEHNLIAGNVFASLHSQLSEKPCTVVPSDMLVWIESARRAVYPDVTVICGEPEFLGDKRDTLLNPTLIVEVLSESTKDYDRGEKFMLYRTLPSFKEYVLIAQDRYYVEHCVRQEDGRWILSEVRDSGAVIGLESIPCRLEVAEIYANVPLGKASLRAVELTDQA